MRAAVQPVFLVTSFLRSEQMNQGTVHLFIEKKHFSNNELRGLQAYPVNLVPCIIQPRSETVIGDPVLSQPLW